MQVQNDRIEPNISTITQNIQKMKERIDELQQVSFTDSEKSAISANAIIQDFAVSAANMRVTQNLLMDTVKYYSDSALFDTEKSLYEKVQTTIKEIKLKLLERKKKELVERKISWFGRIRGLGKLRDIEVTNIELEEQILKNSGIKVKSEYSVQDTLADMRAFSIRELDGQNTEEMEAIIHSVGAVFSFHSDVIEDRARRKLNAVPMVIVDPRKRIGTSEKIAKAERRNGELRAEFVDVYNSYGMNSGFARYTNIDSLEKFYSLLDESVKDTTFESLENTQTVDAITKLDKRTDNSDFGVK